MLLVESKGKGWRGRIWPTQSTWPMGREMGGGGLHLESNEGLSMDYYVLLGVWQVAALHETNTCLEKVVFTTKTYLQKNKNCSCFEWWPILQMLFVFRNKLILKSISICYWRHQHRLLTTNRLAPRPFKDRLLFIFIFDVFFINFLELRTKIGSLILPSQDLSFDTVLTTRSERMEIYWAVEDSSILVLLRELPLWDSIMLIVPTLPYE